MLCPLRRRSQSFLSVQHLYSVICFSLICGPCRFLWLHKRPKAIHHPAPSIRRQTTSSQFNVISFTLLFVRMIQLWTRQEEFLTMLVSLWVLALVPDESWSGLKISTLTPTFRFKYLLEFNVIMSWERLKKVDNYEQKAGTLMCER